METRLSKQLALGLFHFNPQWGADRICSDRHCAEALGPFLKMLESHPTWKISFEISGVGLETLAKHYKSSFDRLGALITFGQIELISALYTPSLWVAFPRHDLVRSIEENLKLLTSYQLPSSRIFFAQEGFFGEGVRRLKEYFDIAVCKDDYLNYFYELDNQRPIRKLGDLRVVVASGHLLCESVNALKDDPALAEKAGLSYRHRSYLEAAKNLNDEANFPFRRGSIETLAWHWYHCGDGNHFCAIAKPNDYEKSFHDRVWTQWNEYLLERLEVGGYVLSSISDLIAAVPDNLDEPLPPLIESSWNPKDSGGVLRWMGKHANPWENDNFMLTTIVKARLRLLNAERTIKLSESSLDEYDELFTRAWCDVLKAQGSDHFGWCPSPMGVAAGFQAAETALHVATEIMDAHVPWKVDRKSDSTTPVDDLPQTLCVSPPSIFGAVGEGDWSQPDANSWIWEARFQSTAPECGVTFQLGCNHLVFSPSGDEANLLELPLVSLKPDVISLPLSNGLIKLEDGWYLVKDLTSVHVAAQIDKRSRTIVFSIGGDYLGHDHVWTFYFVRDTAERALVFANEINCVGAAPCHNAIGGKVA